MLILVLVFSLAGCSTHLIQERALGSIDLESIKPRTEAPLMDSETREDTESVIYCYNSNTGTLDSSIIETHTIGGLLDLHELLDKQIKASIEMNQSVFNGIGLNNKVSLYTVIPSDQTAIVNLSSAFRAVEPEMLYGFRRSIAMTLCSTGIRNAIVLLDGREEGLDLAGVLPAGVFTKGMLDYEDEIRKTRTDFTQKTVFFLPSADGTLLIPSVRDVTYHSASSVEYLYSILEEFSQINRSNPQHLFPEPLSVLEKMPEIKRSEDGNYRVISLHFLDRIYSELKENNLSLHVYLAMLTNTLVCFIPGIDGLQVEVGNKMLTELNAEDTTTGNTMLIQDEVLNWDSFNDLIGTEETVYHTAGRTVLKSVRVSVPALNAKNKARIKLEELFKLWTQDLAFEGITKSDIIAVRAERDSIVINLSNEAMKKLNTLNNIQERLFIYAIVNTLTEGGPQTGVVFFFDGKQVNGQSIVLRGKVYRNPGIIQK